MDADALRETYRAYLDCLNRQDWTQLGVFVAEEAIHNGRAFGLAGYRAMLEADFEQIPDLRFTVALLVCEPPFVAGRLAFDCSPRGRFLGLDVDGRRIAFTENVIYRFAGGRIAEVWSVIDKRAVEDQLEVARSTGVEPVSRP